MAKYKISYNREGCIGASSCVAVNPTFYEMKEDGKVDLTNGKFNDKTKMWELIIDEKDLAINQEAAEVCPVLVIKIEKIED